MIKQIKKERMAFSLIEVIIIIIIVVILFGFQGYYYASKSCCQSSYSWNVKSNIYSYGGNYSYSQNIKDSDGIYLFLSGEPADSSTCQINYIKNVTINPKTKEIYVEFRHLNNKEVIETTKKDSCPTGVMCAGLGAENISNYVCRCSRYEGSGACILLDTYEGNFYEDYPSSEYVNCQIPNGIYLDGVQNTYWGEMHFG